MGADAPAEHAVPQRHRGGVAVAEQYQERDAEIVDHQPHREESTRPDYRVIAWSGRGVAAGGGDLGCGIQGGGSSFF